MVSEAIKDLDKFLAGDGKINIRKVRRSLGSRKGRKSNASRRTDYSNRLTAVKNALAARNKAQV